MNEASPTVDDATADGIDPATLFSLLGRAHTLEILNEVVLGEHESIRFGQLQDSLDLSPNTLSRRLDELVELGFLDRTQYNEMPPRVEYESTEQLADLEPTFRELSNWMERYGSESLC